MTPSHSSFLRAFNALLLSIALLSPASHAADVAQKSEFVPRVGQEGKDVIWVPTPDDVVDKMLEMAEVAPGDRVVDLGSGDGKITIAAAKRGAIAKGIEYNPDMVELSKRNARQAGVQVELVQGDIFKSDFNDADVVTLYLLPTLNERLRPILLAMKPGTRVTSHSFRMGDWKPDQTVNVKDREAHFWRVPANIEGEWQVRIGSNAGPTLRIQQRYQEIEGQGTWGSRAGPLREAVVRGAQVSFILADARGTLHRFEGIADHGGPMMGTVRPVKGGAVRLFTASRRG